MWQIVLLQFHKKGKNECQQWHKLRVKEWNAKCLSSYWKPFISNKMLNAKLSTVRDVKEIVHIKMKICWRCAHPQAVRRWGWVCFFIRFGEMCLSNGCSAVNGCRQNESLIKTSTALQSISYHLEKTKDETDPALRCVLTKIVPK